MSDIITITLNARTMEGLPAQDPAVAVLLLQTSEPAGVLTKWAFAFSDTKILTFPLPTDSFPAWQISIAFSRFDAGKYSSFSFEPMGNASPTLNLQVIRLPGQWIPYFTPLAALASPRFDPLRRALSQSSSIDLLPGATPLGDLNLTFDTLAAPAAILAKSALLNLFSVLLEEHDPVPNIPVPWFTYVRRIVRIGQERFVAEVDPTLFENVSILLASPSLHYKNVRYYTEPDGGRSLHSSNIPALYNAAQNLQQMETIKIAYQQGNLQLTVAYLTVNGVAVHLLDCDMDEDLNLVQHGFDLLKHLFNGGTSPITMHEYIVSDSAKQTADHIAAIDLGYTLS